MQRDQLVLAALGCDGGVGVDGVQLLGVDQLVEVGVGERVVGGKVVLAAEDITIVGQADGVVVLRRQKKREIALKKIFTNANIMLVPVRQ